MKLGMEAVRMEDADLRQNKLQGATKKKKDDITYFLMRNNRV